MSCSTSCYIGIGCGNAFDEGVDKDYIIENVIARKPDNKQATQGMADCHAGQELQLNSAG